MHGTLSRVAVCLFGASGCGDGGLFIVAVEGDIQLTRAEAVIGDISFLKCNDKAVEAESSGAVDLLNPSLLVVPRGTFCQVSFRCGDTKEDALALGGTWEEHEFFGELACENLTLEQENFTTKPAVIALDLDELFKQVENGGNNVNFPYESNQSEAIATHLMEALSIGSPEEQATAFGTRWTFESADFKY